MCLSSYMWGSRAGLVFFFSLAVARKRQKQGEKRWGSKGLLLAPDAAGSAVFSSLLVFATRPALSVQLVALSARGKSCRGSQGSAAYGVGGALGCRFFLFFSSQPFCSECSGLARWFKSRHPFLPAFSRLS